MSRTVLAAVALMGLIAYGCTAKPKKGAAPSGSAAASTQGTAPKAGQSKKKATAKPDTAPAKNPLTN